MTASTEAVEGTGSGPPDPATLTERQFERRQRIVRAAITLLDEREYEKVQMREVADSAGVALGTVYRYFASKEHLFGAARAEWGSALSKSLERAPLRGDGPAARLDELFQRVLSAFERRPQFFRLITMLEATPDPYARELAREANEQVRRTFIQPLVGLDRERAEAIVDVISAVLGAVLRQWSQGFIDMPQARKRMSRAIDLIDWTDG